MNKGEKTLDNHDKLTVEHGRSGLLEEPGVNGGGVREGIVFNR